MLYLKENIARIQNLVKENTASSLTYAALECRLALEHVCYYRLRNVHKYISADDLKKWQPKDVINQLIMEVEPNIASTFTLSIQTEPASQQKEEFQLEEFQKLEYEEVGTQIGFDPKKIGKLWHTLGNFLHVTMPKSEKDTLNIYGDLNNLRNKIIETVDELEKLSEGTLVMSSMGKIISLECPCGSTNKRLAEVVKAGMNISCINRDCTNSWHIKFENGDTIFVLNETFVDCKKCGKKHTFPSKNVFKLSYKEKLEFKCECGENNCIKWILAAVK